MENHPTSQSPQGQGYQLGLGSRMMLEPGYIRPGYKGSEKLLDKVALISSKVLNT